MPHEQGQIKDKIELIECVVRLNEHLQTPERESIYEAPLAAAFAKNGLGEVSGGGTVLKKNGEIDHIGLELVLHDREEGIKFVCELLEALGAPKGSRLWIEDESISFGVLEGLGIYIDALNLPDSVYESCDINTVWEELEDALEERGRITGYWEGPEYTAFYLYGISAEAMQEAVLPFLATYPLCKGARILRITPD